MSDETLIDTNMGVMSHTKRSFTVALSSCDIAEVACAGKNMLFLVETYMREAMPDVYKLARADAYTLIRIGGELQAAHYQAAGG